MVKNLIRILLGMALSLTAVPVHAQVGSPQTKANLANEINSNFPNNITGAITPTVLRQVTLDMVQSWQQFAGFVGQTGTSYAISGIDYGQLNSFTNTAAVAVSLPNAATTGFTAFNTYVQNVASSLLTITPAVGTINGAASSTLNAGQTGWVISDGINWHLLLIVGGGGAGGTPGGANTNIQYNNFGAFAGDARLIYINSGTANGLQFSSTNTNFGPKIAVVGTDTSISLNLTSKGTGGSINLNTPFIFIGNLETSSYTDSATATLTIGGTANAVNLIGSTTGNAVKVSATGSDTNVALNLVTQGTGVLQLNSVQFATTPPGGTTNFLRADGTWAVPSGGGGTPTFALLAGGAYGAL